MSVVELSTRRPPTRSQRSLCGWGRVAARSCSVLEPRDVQDVLDALDAGRTSGTGLIARGAGRSYGDAAQNADGVVLDMTALDRIVAVDVQRRLITAQAGATIAQLMARLAADGLGLPVVPGTRHVTLAGAIASDIHGKNHHRDGGFARHVANITLCTPSAGTVLLSPETDAELFYATLGGMGLTGVIVEATLHAEPLASPWVSADVDRTAGLSETLELLSGDEHHRYSVAWLDLLADGARAGRAVISRADPLPLGAQGPSASRRRRASAPYPAALSRLSLIHI